MTELVNVLLVEDNAGDARLVSEALSEPAIGSFRVQWVERLSAALLFLSEGGYDVVVLDPGLPDSQGIETIAAVRSAAPQMPVVVLSGTADEQFAIEAVQASAQDYLVKGRADGYALARSLRYAIERKRAEEALRDSEERLRLAMRVANESIYEVNTAAGTISCNDTFLRNFGRPEDGSHFEWWRRRIHPEDATRIPASLDAALRGHAESWMEEYRVLRLDGSWADVHDRFVIRRDEFGTAVRIVGAILDISERKQARESLEAANRQLRQLSRDLLRSQDEERRRIARELHDGTVQLLAAIQINLCRVLDSGCVPQRQHELLGEALELTAECARDLRTTAYLLHPPLLDEVGLAGAVRSYVEGFGRRTGIRIEVRIPCDFARMAAEVEAALFRIVQEGMANVHKHSGSATAVVELKRTSGQVHLRLEDHGRGMPKEAGGVYFGVGILGMRERVQQLGGILEIYSGQTGTVLNVTLPEKEQHAEN